MTLEAVREPDVDPVAPRLEVAVAVMADLAADLEEGADDGVDAADVDGVDVEAAAVEAVGVVARERVAQHVAEVELRMVKAPGVHFPEGLEHWVDEVVVVEEARINAARLMVVMVVAMGVVMGVVIIVVMLELPVVYWVDLDDGLLVNGLGIDLGLDLGLIVDGLSIDLGFVILVLVVIFDGFLVVRSNVYFVFDRVFRARVFAPILANEVVTILNADLIVQTGD